MKLSFTVFVRYCDNLNCVQELEAITRYLVVRINSTDIRESPHEAKLAWRSTYMLCVDVFFNLGES